MKIFLSILGIAGVLFSLPAQNSAQAEAGVLNAMIREIHYAPSELNDSLCTQIAKMLVEEIDSRKIHFTQTQLDKIYGRAFILKSDLKGKTWEFEPFLSAMYNEALQGYLKDLENVLNIPMDLDKGDSIKPSSKSSFVSSASDLKSRRANYAKHMVLRRLIALEDSLILDKKRLADHESKIRMRVLKNEQRRINTLLEDGLSKVLTQQLFNCYTLSLDAHSVYLPSELFEKFRDELDTEEFSFGLELTENEEGETYIYRLVPGGNAWKTNELFKDEVLIGIVNEKSVEYFDGLEVEEIEDLMNKYTQITLRVREPNGRQKDVPLKKERIRKEDNKVKGIVLNGKKKIGYISLPGFYTEWENTESSGCSNDVAREILKLKDEGIEGIILDIRSNGGGSLHEGLSMAGIFINEGPLYLKKERDQRVQVVKDMNRGTVYDGPLVVMVNGQSASASEVLAAVLQDYNRAVLVGSRTYGKATGQLVLPVDTTHSMQGFLRPARSDVKHGYTLLTTQKLFRITGKTAQIRGVHPDIELPDYLDGYQEREEQQPTALPAEDVVKKVYYTPLPALPLAALRKSSKERVQDGPLGKIPELLTQYWQLPEEKVLNLQFYRSLYKQNYALWKELEAAISTADRQFECENTMEMKKILELDEFERSNYDYLKKNISSDSYLIESYQVICDLIDYK